jgi:multidrug efflux pump
VDNALYNGFGQRQVATIYAELNQYHVIMEVAPRYTRSPESLKDIYVPAKQAAAAQHRHHHTSAAALHQHGHHGITARPRHNRTSSASQAPEAPTLRCATLDGNVLSTAATTMVPLSAIAKFSREPDGRLGQP